MDGGNRRNIAVCTTWEDEENLNLMLGACSCTERNHLPIDQLLAEADKALYEDKNSRRR